MNDDYGVSMTREAKIGLLVALAFLLVIGILLSDHVTTATRQPQATLAGVQSNIRDGLAAPGANAPAPQSGALPVLPDQPPADPGRPFTLNQAQPANGQVEVQRGVPENGDLPRGAQVSGVDPWINTQAPEQIIGPGMLDARDALARQATLGGEPIAPADARPQPQQGGAGEYVVQPGEQHRFRQVQSCQNAPRHPGKRGRPLAQQLSFVFSNLFEKTNTGGTGKTGTFARVL